MASDAPASAPVEQPAAEGPVPAAAQDADDVLMDAEKD